MIRLALVSLFIAALILQVPGIRAGSNKCNPEQGPPCGMKTCAHMAKKQQWCSPKCHKDCCRCEASCNGHNPEQPRQPEEESQ